MHEGRLRAYRNILFKENGATVVDATAYLGGLLIINYAGGKTFGTNMTTPASTVTIKKT